MSDGVITLVACSKEKKLVPTVAKDMYISRVFRLRSTLAEANGVWFILSANYQLLSPTTEIEPYDEWLAKWSADRRRCWQENVRDSLVALAPSAVVIHAGAHYYEPVLEKGLVDHGIEVQVPCRGMSISRTYQHLKGMMHAI